MVERLIDDELEKDGSSHGLNEGWIWLEGQENQEKPSVRIVSFLAEVWSGHLSYITNIIIWDNLLSDIFIVCKLCFYLN
jgi:hypothetical protein